MRIADNLGDLPIQDLIYRNLLTSSETSSAIYLDEAMIEDEDWYLDREQQYGQGYTERAIELAYKILKSMEILDPFD